MKNHTNSITKFEPLLYSKKDAAAMLGVSVFTLHRLITQGQLKPRYVGDRPMFSKSELERFAGVAA